LRDVVFADDMKSGPPVRLLFGSPVTGKIETGANIWGGAWYVTTKFAQYYDDTGKPAYHPSVDLNLANYADAGKPVYASADGDIVVSGAVQGWQGQMVVIEHTLEDGRKLWTRYAHLKDVPAIGQTRVHVKRADVIGTIGEYLPAGPQNDHLDFGGCWDDLGSRPGDWPGMDKTRIINQYIDMEQWLRQRAK
jgi:murein DD-endopeptidase MepM/ murein hydrolase activator NlpD